MGKVYDLGTARQKKSEVQKRFRDNPPFLCLRSKDGKREIYPRWEKGRDGKWWIQDPDSFKSFLVTEKGTPEKP
jgi:hypothetical protein